MSTQIQRQSDLFLGEDWKVIYEAYTNLNFKSYSFTTIKAALIEYIRINYSEDFNDWTQNSEFMFHIDLLAYLSETLSYRVDLNARDNFIDNSERKESILRLAKLISYNPKRNFNARGKLKIKSVKTTQIIEDSEGRNLQNKIILWNDPSNPDWFEQFVLVLNSAFISSNPFGKPIKTIKNGNQNSQLYRVNSTSRSGITLPFTASVSGETMNFEIINPDLDEFGNVFERHPDPDGAKHVLYLNDGAGNASINTGFFLYFKQGNLKEQNFLFDRPIENRVTDIELTNINELDVWVSKINENGNIIEQWEKVPTVENIVYNSIDSAVRNIYSVITRDEDKVSIRFSDGRFGTVPKGIFRIWTRQSNGLEYTINPMEIRAKTTTVQYFKNTGIDKDSTYELSITFDLFDSVSNASASESLDDIKTRAPRVYYTQNRMVNGEDYNSFPLSFGTQVSKLKSVNRIYSGQSKYFDNTDPTRKYSSTVEFGDDGIIFKEDYYKYSIERLPTTKNVNQIITSNILPLLYDVDLNNFFIDRYKSYNLAPTGNSAIEQGGYYWNKVSGNFSVASGYFSSTLNGSAIQINSTSTFPLNYVMPGAYLEFENPVLVDENDSPNLDYDNYIKKNIWAKVLDVANSGLVDANNPTEGPVSVDEIIPSDWRIKRVIPAFSQNFSVSELSLIAAQIENKNTFGLRYDLATKSWRIVDELNVSAEDSVFSTANAGSTANTNLDASWLIRAQYTANEYIFKVRLLKYVFESDSISRFFFVNEVKGVNVNKNKTNRDIINILKLNEDLSTDKLLVNDYQFTISESIRYSDGFIEPRRVQIVPYDSDGDGSLDFPNAFDYITNTEASILENNYVFSKKGLDESGFEYYYPVYDINSQTNLSQLEEYDWDQNDNNYQAGFNVANKKFYVWDEDEEELVEVTNTYKYYVGRTNLNYKYAHYTNENYRIDPAITNVIDNYVLTSAYLKNVTEWKNSDRLKAFPSPENAEELQNTFSELNNFKMISDQILWNPAKFKLLFGTEALAQNQATFKVVKIDSTSLTDNQIKQGILNAIETYFHLDNWSFGEQIFTTELLAYIHKVMATDISSIIMVPKQVNAVGARNPEDIYQIRLEFNELPLNTATVSDIEIVKALTKANINS